MNFDAPLVSICFGIFFLLFYGWMWLMPEPSDRALRAYPRSVWPARILVAVSMVWFCYNLNQVDLGRFNDLKTGLWVLAPVGTFLVIHFIPDLLAVRGLCTVALLAGQPLLVAVRWHGSPAQHAVALLIYLLMIKCMILVVYPHLWIRGIDFWTVRPGLRKKLLSGGIFLGLTMLVCGLISL
ncbi:MAG: hypothetical protein ACO3NW_10185 [Kiritimatiellia bacterium]